MDKLTLSKMNIRLFQECFFNFLYIKKRLVYLAYRGIHVPLSQVVQVYPVHTFLSPRLPCVIISRLCFWWVAVVDGCIWGNGVSRVLGCLWDPWRAYLKMFSPAPSSHWGRCTLIRCAGILVCSGGWRAPK